MNLKFISGQKMCYPPYFHRCSLHFFRAIPVASEPRAGSGSMYGRMVKTKYLRKMPRHTLQGAPVRER